MTSFLIICSEGYQTPVYGWLPGGEPTAIIHIAHGMAEYAERYAPIAEMLVKKGIAVYAHDQRAHGRAVADESALGLADRNWFNNQVDDMRYIIKHLRDLHPGKKIFLLGHSMGSFVAQRFFQSSGELIDGLILSASNGQKDPLLPLGIFVAGMQAKLMGVHHRSKLINTLSFGKFNKAFKPNRTTFDWLSRNNEEVDKYIASPLCGFICSAGYFHSFFKGINDLLKKENIKNIPAEVPVYLFSGDKDPVGLFGKGFMRLYENWKAAGVKDISYKLYPGGRHEMLNEVNREEVVEDLLSWLDGKLAS